MKDSVSLDFLGKDSFFDFNRFSEDLRVKLDDIISPKVYFKNKKSSNESDFFLDKNFDKEYIDFLCSEKMFSSWKRFTKEGQEEVGELKRGKDGLILSISRFWGKEGYYFEGSCIKKFLCPCVIKI